MKRRRYDKASALRRLAAAAALVVLSVSCARAPADGAGTRPPAAVRTTFPVPAPGSLPPAGPAEPLEPDGGSPDGGLPAVAMRPAPRGKPAQAARPAVAPSLAGFDRHLAGRPFDVVTATDFELGPLASSDIEPDLAGTLRDLGAGLVAGKLPLDRFDAAAAAITGLILSGPLAAKPGIVEARFSAPRVGPGGTATVALRVLGAVVAGSAGSPAGTASRPSAPGLAILGKDDSGAWRIMHLELDLEALGASPARPGPWDPYSTPPPY